MSRQPSIADLAVGRSAIRRRILALLIADPDLRYHLRDVQRRTRTTPGTASRELGNLVDAGLAEREPEGSFVYFRAARSPFAEMLRSLLVTEAAEAESEPIGPAPAASRFTPNATDLAAIGPFRDAMQAEFQDRFGGVLLYGSRARGDARPDSDVNLLVVLDRIDDYYEAVERSSPATSSLALELGAIVSRVFATERQLDESDDAFFVRARGEAVPV